MDGELGALLDEAFDLAAVVEPRGRIAYLNGAGRRLLALGDEAAPELFELVVPADREILRAGFAGLVAGRPWSGVVALVQPAGDVPTRTTLVPLPSGRVGWLARDISTERAIYERLHKKIFEDEVTGLPHRSIFLDRLDLALRRHGDDAPPVALLFLSIDRFKERSERFGHEVGDQLLRAVAARLVAEAGPHTVSRWGGDEFVVLLEDGGVAAARELAARLAGAVAGPVAVAGSEVHLTISVGVAHCQPGDPATRTGTEQLIRHADVACQAAKRRGGGGVQVFDEELQARTLRRAEVEEALRGAATRGELVLHFQPEISLHTNEIVGVEALVRWQHPRWGLVSPSEFVPVAETSDLILEIGEWVLDQVMRQAVRWREAVGDAAPTVGVNISGRQFEQDDFVELVTSTLEATGAEPGDLCLEITETVLMQDLDVTGATLRRLKVLGVQLAVDDFGTGYSSLSYLRRFPVDVLKVDQSFVRGLGHDPEDSAIVEAVVSMGRALNLTTVAEGVETAHQLIELREVHCDVGQGFHFARPRPAEEVTRMLKAGPDWQRVEA